MKALLCINMNLNKILYFNGIERARHSAIESKYPSIFKCLCIYIEGNSLNYMYKNNTIPSATSKEILLVYFYEK